MTDIRRFNALCRVDHILDINGSLQVVVVIPGWNPHRKVALDASVFPEGLVQSIEMSPGPQEETNYIYCMIDYNAESGSELKPEGPWELRKVHHGDMVTDENGRVTDFGVQVLYSQKWDEKGHISDY